MTKNSQSEHGALVFFFAVFPLIRWFLFTFPWYSNDHWNLNIDRVKHTNLTQGKLNWRYLILVWMEYFQQIGCFAQPALHWWLHIASVVYFFPFQSRPIYWLENTWKLKSLLLIKFSMQSIEISLQFRACSPASSINTVDFYSYHFINDKFSFVHSHHR